ncbi:MAG: hypothetical protein HY200_04465 [Nitrospirae bacterium]|nr:hypothetical protein [Nitrospirota bacterium]
MPWLVGIAALLIAGILYFPLSHTSRVTSSPAYSSNLIKNGREISENRSITAGPLKLTLSPNPLTAENDIAVLSGGLKSVNVGERFEWERNGAVIPGEQSSLFNKSLIRKGDRIKVRLLTQPGSEPVESEPIVVENALPKVVSIAIEPFPPTRRDKLTAKVEGFDADGDPITYSYRWLKEDESVVGNDLSIPGSLFNKKEKVILEVTPSDGVAQGQPMRRAMIISKALPKITSIPASFQGNEYSYQVTAEDPDSDPLTFTLTKGPVGMTIDSKTGLIKWAFTEKDAGNHPIEIKVSDPDGEGDSQSYMLPLSFTSSPAR